MEDKLQEPFLVTFLVAISAQGGAPSLWGLGFGGLGCPAAHPAAGSKGIWERRPPNHHDPNGKGLGRTPPLPAGFGGIETRQIQLPDGLLTFRGAAGFGNEGKRDLGWFSPRNKNPARTRSRQPLPIWDQTGAHEGLGGTCVHPPCSILMSPWLPEQQEFPAPASRCPPQPGPKKLGCAARLWLWENKRIWGGFWGCAGSPRGPGLLCLGQLCPAPNSHIQKCLFFPARFPGKTHKPEETQHEGPGV